jgi:hypothetical protein
MFASSNGTLLKTAATVFVAARAFFIVWLVLLGPRLAAEPVTVTPLPSTAAPSESAPVGTLSPDAETPTAPDPERGEFATPNPIPIGNGYLVGGSLDMRGRTKTGGFSERTWVNAAELQIQHPITTDNTPRGNVKVQLIFEDPVDGSHERDVQLGEAYVLYKLPLRSADPSSAYLKVGQFQVPFGLLAEYDPHLDLIQPLYPQSIGLRNDWGVAIAGRFYGYLTYDFSVTSGSGPNRADINPNRLVCFRLGRTFVTRNGVMNVGGSLLSGVLPVTNIDADHPFANELPPSGRIRANRGSDFTEKTRICGDGTYTFKALTARGEVVTGAEGDNRVFGYFLYGAYRFQPHTSAIWSRSYWIYPRGSSNSSRDAIGLSLDISRTTALNAVIEKLRDVPENMAARDRRRVTAQLLIRF